MLIYVLFALAIIALAVIGLVIEIMDKADLVRMNNRIMELEALAQQSK